MARIFIGVVLCLALMIVALLLSAVRHGYDAEDTLACVLTTGMHSTRYATGYTSKAFSQIRPGMTPDEVGNILGEPLRRVTWSSWPEGDWDYSEPATSSGHYHARRVRFSADGSVSAAYKLFYFD
jgi:outer membrane protein assembly factor BamE (lipoprotein component of BamABCDE complex)